MRDAMLCLAAHSANTGPYVPPGRRARRRACVARLASIPTNLDTLETVAGEVVARGATVIDRKGNANSFDQAIIVQGDVDHLGPFIVENRELDDIASVA